MGELVTLDSSEAHKRLSLFRLYFFEISILILTSAVGYLFSCQRAMEKEFRVYLQNDQRASTEAIQRNSELIIDMKTYLLSTK